jgi:hypothetical protein
MLMIAATAAQSMTGDWLSNHSTLLVGVVGIVVSGILGPAASVWLSRKSARQQFKRDLIVARRDDLRQLVDEAALLLAPAARISACSTKRATGTSLPPPPHLNGLPASSHSDNASGYAFQRALRRQSV